MIRSGLVNQQKGGGFEKGYPHQRDNNPRDRLLRPYVDGFDTGIGVRSDLKQIVPEPVSYEKIFGKKTSPDERLFLLRMAQKGVSKTIQTLGKAGLAGKPTIEAPPLPVNNEYVEEPAIGDVPDIPTKTETFEDADYEMVQASEPVFLKDELMAQDVVEPPVHQETFDEQMLADEIWVKQEPIVEHKEHLHMSDDVIVFTENSFGGNVQIPTTEPELQIAPQVETQTLKAVQINGIGPRYQTDSNRLKAIQQRARMESFDANRTIGPMREQISRWKTTEERMEEKRKKKKEKEKEARRSTEMRGRDYGKLPAPEEQLFASLPEPSVEKEAIPKPKKVLPKKGEIKKKEAGKRKSSRPTSQKTVQINSVKNIILKLTKKEEELKKKGKKLPNNQFLALMKAEKELAQLLK